MTQTAWPGLKPLGAFRTRGQFVTRPLSPRLARSADGPFPSTAVRPCRGEQGNAERPQSQIAPSLFLSTSGLPSHGCHNADLPLQPRQSPEVSVKTKIRSQCAWMEEPPQGSAVSPKAWSCLLEQSGLSHSRGEPRDGASPLGCHLSLALRTFWMLQLMLKRDLLSHDLDQVLSLGSRLKAYSEPMDSWGCPAGLWPCSCFPQQDHAGQDESPESWRLH